VVDVRVEVEVSDWVVEVSVVEVRVEVEVSD